MNDAYHIELIKRRINELLGLHYSASQQANLLRNLELVANDLGVGSGNETMLKWLMREQIPDRDLEVLASYLTVGETYFFREKLALKLLLETIIPAHIASQRGTAQRPLRIWSAGCSSGEEIYSIAIALRESFPNLKNLPLMLLGTDVNARALDKARTGIYTPWSFRATPDTIKEKYFTRRDKSFVISEEIRSMVHFERLNLVTGQYPSAGDELMQMDVIFCRNVLMYFSPEMIRRVARKLYSSLRAEGWLITGQVEINDEYFGEFQRVLFEDGIFYRKTTPVQKGQQPLQVLMPRTEQVGKQKKVVRKLKLKPKSSNILTQKSNGLRKPQPAPDFAEPEADQTAALYASATTLANSGKLGKAQQVMKKLIESDGAEAEHFYLYAIILMEKQEWEEADRNLVKALYLDPMHLAARLSRTQVLKYTGRQDKADRELDNLIRDIENYDDKEPLPTLDGMTAGRLREMTGSLTRKTQK